MKRVFLFLIFVFAFAPDSFSQLGAFDCSTSDCTCEVTITLEDVGTQPLDQVQIFYGIDGLVFLCAEDLTESGVYQFTLDGNFNGLPINLEFRLTGDVTGVVVNTTVSGCDLNEEFVLSFNNNFEIFSVFRDCSTECVTLEDDCDNVTFEYCCDGTLTADFTGIVHYVKVFDTETWESVGYLCNAWDGIETLCNGTMTMQLDPNKSYEIELNGGDTPVDENTPPDWDEYPFGTNLCADDRIPIPTDFCSSALRSKTANENNVAINESIKIFPNPTKDFLNISNVEGRNLSVEIYSTNGQQLISEQLNGSTADRIDVSNLSLGIYIVRVRDLENAETIANEKLIITE